MQLTLMSTVCHSTCVIMKEVEQRKQLEEVEGEQEISNVQRVQEKSEVDQTEILAGEKSIIEDLVVPEEEMVEPLTTDLGPPVVAAEEDTSEPLLLSVVKKEVRGSYTV